ncbi:MAG: ATP-dependent RecD-like DNA helicase, partial [Clostridiales bacterium]|nr:ATP-dependent RecD-like DNA helicase [Clostridiales bacterium]
MKSESLLEMTGSVEQVIFKNESNGYTIIEMNNGEELVTVVGTMPFVSVGEELRVIGNWINNPNYGTQFKVEAFERSKPATAVALLKYLASGAIKGIGPSTAGKIVDAFGMNALEIIENDPERLCEIKGITKARARKISDEFQKTHGIKEIMLYLGSYGISPEEAIRVWKYYGPESAERVREDPYCLCRDGI